LQPDADYKRGEKAYLEFEDRRRGTFLVIIASEGRWNQDKQDNEYQLTLGDGTPYKNGDWIEENILKSK
jgi:hypothetical protein